MKSRVASYRSAMAQEASGGILIGFGTSKARPHIDWTVHTSVLDIGGLKGSVFNALAASSLRPAVPSGSSPRF